MKSIAERPSPSAQRDAFIADVRYYLRLDPRQLPSRYLYDPLGSALFDAITLLPWYGVTRAEARLLASHGAEIFKRLGGLSTVLELGSGNGEKLHLLLAEATSPRPLVIDLVDVSSTALVSSSRALADLDEVTIVTHQASYEDGLRELAGRPHASGRCLVLFLGSNIGNFDPPGCDAFLRTVRAALRPGDGFLLGADLVKPEHELQLAYDDPLGVTAAFNRNILQRINRELGGHFDLQAFSHRAVWNGSESRMEMHLVSAHAQDVRIEAASLDVEFAAGDAIWTESSYKFEPADLIARVERSGFRSVDRWVDAADRFELILFEVS
jgi:dimethylhistidine N-methyltransferase